MNIHVWRLVWGPHPFTEGIDRAGDFKSRYAQAQRSVVSGLGIDDDQPSAVVRASLDCSDANADEFFEKRIRKAPKSNQSYLCIMYSDFVCEYPGRI